MTTCAIFQLVRDFEKKLSAACVDSPRLCAELIVGEAAGMSRAQLIAFGERELSSAELARARAMLLRRERGEPLAYILGRKEFYGREFKVSPAVLVPRPETELIIELALQRFERTAPLQFIDLGCGSGCIIATLLAEAPAWLGAGVDISAGALDVTAENLARHEVAGRARLLNADFADLNLFAAAAFDLIVSNPPYIPTAEYETLGREVKNFEPRQALDSGPDGLTHPRQVAAQALHALKPAGLLLMEIGSEQGVSARGLFDPAAWQTVEIIPDLAGLDRLIRAVKR